MHVCVCLHTCVETCKRTPHSHVPLHNEHCRPCNAHAKHVTLLCVIIKTLQEREFEAQMAKETESELKRILDEQKDERKNLELGFLDARQDLKRSELTISFKFL